MTDGRIMQVGMILNDPTGEAASTSESRRKRSKDMSMDLPKTPPKKRLAHLPYLFDSTNPTQHSGQDVHQPKHHKNDDLPPSAWPTLSFCSDKHPPRDVISRCVAAFSRGYGDLYCLLPEGCIMELFRKAYSHSVTNTSKPKAVSEATNNGLLTKLESSLLMLCAAVGAVYLEDSNPEAAALKVPLFLSGKTGLDAILEESEGTEGEDETSLSDGIARVKISACALTALYLVFEKHISARWYIGHAIHLALSTGLNQTSSASTRPTMNSGAQEHAEMTAADMDSWSRVWRSLIFLDGWMSNSVGFTPIIDSSALVEGFYSGQEATEYDGGLNTQMGNLGILMSAITRDVCTAAVVDMNLVREYSESLKRWHDNLPHTLKLSGALDFQSNASHRTSILLTHTAYLSSLILLTRRILVVQARSPSRQGVIISTLVNAVEDEPQKLSHECIYAAKQLATVVNILFTEGRLVRRCWLGIQAAFTACLVIFLEMSLDLRKCGGPLPQTDVELVSRCMYVLEYCAVADVIARSYLNAVVPIRNALFAMSATGHNWSAGTPERVGSPSIHHTCSPPPPIQRQSPVVHNSALLPLPTYPSINAIVIHILEWLEAPYGGESKIVSEAPQNAAKHSRFLNANPPQLPRLATELQQTSQQNTRSPSSSLYGFSLSRQASPTALAHSPQPQSNAGSPASFSLPPSPTQQSGRNPVSYRLQRSTSRYASDPTSVASPGGPLPDVRALASGSGSNPGVRRKMPFKTMEEYEQFLKRVV